MDEQAKALDTVLRRVAKSGKLSYSEPVVLHESGAILIAAAAAPRVFDHIHPLKSNQRRRCP